MAAIYKMRDNWENSNDAIIDFSDDDIQTHVVDDNGMPFRAGVTAIEWSTATPPLAVAVWQFLGSPFANQWGKLTTF